MKLCYKKLNIKIYNNKVLIKLCLKKENSFYTGKKYELKYYMYYVNRNHKDHEGVFQIWLYDTEIYTEENDYPDNGKYGIYLMLMMSRTD